MKKIFYLFIFLLIVVSGSIYFINYFVEDKKVNEVDKVSDVNNISDNNSIYNKKLSILGDSISTYDGYSNNNDSIKNNQIWYPKDGYNVDDVSKTWWSISLSNTKMQLLVNNSSSGSHVIGNGNQSHSRDDEGVRRAVNLDDKHNPDIIAVFMGINDFNAKYLVGDYSDDLYDKLIENENGDYFYKEPNNFTEAYIIMIHKIVTKYKNADVFCFTLLPNTWNEDIKNLERYNYSIKKIAEYFGIEVVDLYNETGITLDNYNLYLTDGLHPNDEGMKKISDVFVKKLREQFIF